MANNHKDRNFKLTYFDVRALGEPIRWIFHYFNVPFEDVRIPWDYPKWFESTKKNYLSTVGQIPVLEFDNGIQLCQSQAISKYLAAEFGFTGETNWELALIDEIISLVFDLFNIWRMKFFALNEQSKTFLQTQIDGKFPLYYAKFNKILEESGGDYVIGKKLTHADFWLASFIDIFDGPLGDRYLPVMPFNLPPPQSTDYKENMSANYPKLHAHKERVMNIPQIKTWIEKRPNSAG